MLRRRTSFDQVRAGLIGTAVAFLGIFLGRLLHNPFLDPVASLLIGLLLAAVAALLGGESGGLLVGERTNRAIIGRVRRIIENDSSVDALGDLLTLQLGPNEVLLTVNVRFRRGLDVQELEAAIDRLESRIRYEEPTIKRIFLEADSLKPPIRNRSLRSDSGGLQKTGS